MSCNIGTGAGITNGTIAFLILRKLKWGATWCFCHVMPLPSAVASHGATGIGVGVMYYHLDWSQHVMQKAQSMIPFLGQDDQHKAKQDFFGHVTPLVPAWHHVMQIVLSMAPLHFLCHDNKWVQHYFWSFDTTGTGSSVTCCQQHNKWHHCIPSVKTTEMKCNITFLSCNAMGVDISDMMSMVLSMGPLYSLGQQELKWSATWLFW